MRSPWGMCVDLRAFGALKAEIDLDGLCKCSGLHEPSGGLVARTRTKEVPVACTILLAHRHPLVREGLKAVCSRQEDWRVIGEAGNGGDAITFAIQLQP